MPRLPRLTLLCAGLAMAGACAAGSAGANFTVQINLRTDDGRSPSPESCVSATVDRASSAEVRVLCTPGQFVNIQPAMGPGLAGGAGRAVAATQYGSFLPERILYEAGELTSLRVLSVREDGRWLEMLVSF